MGASIKTTHDSIELNVVHPVYKTKYVKQKGSDEKVEKSVLLKEMRVKKWFKRDAITSIEEHITVQNKISKTKCIVYDRYSGRYFAVWHQVSDILAVTSPNSKPIGFTNYARISTRKA